MGINETLQEIGLNQNEVKVYLALLQLGSSKVSEIVIKTGFPRTFVYEISRSLISKGLVSYVIKSGVRYYEAANPERLKSIIREKEEKLNQILPELKQLTKVVLEKPSVEFYEGKQGMKTILDDILSMKSSSIMYAYSSSKIFKFLQYAFPNFVKRRIKGKIWGKIIQEKNPELLKFLKELKKTYSEMRYLSTTFETSVFIYGDKVAFLTMREEEPVGILIKDKDIAATELKVFNFLWKIAKA